MLAISRNFHCRCYHLEPRFLSKLLRIYLYSSWPKLASTLAWVCHWHLSIIPHTTHLHLGQDAWYFCLCYLALEAISQMLSCFSETVEHLQLPYPCFCHLHCPILCQNSSFELLTPSQLYDMHSNQIQRAYWYYDGRVDMISKGYMPTLVLALLMLQFFNVLPLVLLALYPFNCF